MGHCIRPSRAGETGFAAVRINLLYLSLCFKTHRQHHCELLNNKSPGHIEQCPSQIWSRSRHAKNFTAGIWWIFRGLNYSHNPNIKSDIRQISHLWMGTRTAWHCQRDVVCQVVFVYETVEIGHDFSYTKISPAEISRACTRGYPLLVRPELVGAPSWKFFISACVN
jgi:hypothetical protein